MRSFWRVFAFGCFFVLNSLGCAQRGHDDFEGTFGAADRGFLQLTKASDEYRGRIYADYIYPVRLRRDGDVLRGIVDYGKGSSSPLVVRKSGDGIIVDESGSQVEFPRSSQAKMKKAFATPITGEIVEDR